MACNGAVEAVSNKMAHMAKIHSARSTDVGETSSDRRAAVPKAVITSRPHFRYRG